jgi:hypothetical protein
VPRGVGGLCGRAEEHQGVAVLGRRAAVLGHRDKLAVETNQEEPVVAVGDGALGGPGHDRGPVVVALVDRDPASRLARIWQPTTRDEG